ncbi:MAG TPA: DUF885 domain-containing protein [Verrucomicrobiae bacterium]|jgi:uncharacterized protein (DUF885 family)
MKTIHFLLFILLTASAFGQTPTAVGSGDAAFDRLAEGYFSGYLAWRPLEAVGLGFHEYDGKMTDFSQASIEGEVARLKDFDRRLDGFNTSTLSPRAYFDFRDLRAGIRRELFRFEEMGTFRSNPMTYAGALDVSPFIKRNFAPLNQRMRAIIDILNQAPLITAAGRANLGDSLPKPWVEAAIEVGDGSADFLEHDLVEALKNVNDATLRAEFDAADHRAVVEMRDFVKFLKEEKLPKATLDFALGRDSFAKMLREGELIMQSPDEILEIGLAELQREQKLFAETAAKIDPKRKPIDVFTEIQSDHPTAKGLIPDTRKDLEAIRKFVVNHHIVTIPSQVRPRVEETLPFERAGSFASMDTPGPFETKATEAYYYVTPVEAAWTAKEKEDWLRAFNYYTGDVVSIHEVYPGHYVQFLCMNASPATKVEKILGSYAFIEGWAHYSEQMLVDEGFGEAGPAAGAQPKSLKAAKYRLAQLDESMLRLCRLCVAIKMHCQGMSLADGAKFFHENCFYGEKPAYAEARRGTFDPGYANYTLGKLMILKLRKDYQHQQGADYSLEKFHNELLRHGTPPLPLLREIMLTDQALWPKAL